MRDDLSVERDAFRNRQPVVSCRNAFRERLDVDDGGILYPVFRHALALLDDAYDDQKGDGKRVLYAPVVSASDGVRRRGLYAVSCGDGIVYDLIEEKISE